MKAYETVATRIQELILSGELAPGSRLPEEAKLAELHKVGRSSVREALRVLGGRGWITMTRGPGGGAFVNTPEPMGIGHSFGDSLAFLVGGESISVAEVMEARILHENAAVRLAAHRAGPTEVQKIKQLAADADKLVNDPAAFDEANLSFHIAIAEAAHNQVLIIWLAAIRRALENLMSTATHTPDTRRHVAAQHQAIANAIASSNAEAAATAMASHLHDFEADLFGVISTQTAS